MRSINTDLIEKILLINNKLLKFADKNIFFGTLLTPTQFNMLGEIIVNNGLTVNDLKDKIIVSAPALSQLLNRLEKSGLIERNIGKNDKREIKLTPTKKAKELYSELNKKYINFANEKLGNIDNEEKYKVINFLEKVEKTIY